MKVLGFDPPTTVVPGRGIFRVLYGSHAHGLATETSDCDWRGVFLLPNNAFLGLDRAQTTFEVKANDEVYWELGHFCRLLLKGNPNIVGMLFAPSDVVESAGPQIQPLIDNRELFVHSGTVKAYWGWVHRELTDIGKLHKGNAKRLSHVPRLLWELESMLTTGSIEVRPPGLRRDTIMAIKTGQMDYDDAVAYCGSLLLDVEERLFSRETQTEVPEPPRYWLERYLLETRERYGR